MPLLALPNELLLQIGRFLLHCPTCHCHHVSHGLSPLSRSNRRLHDLLFTYLLHTASVLHILLWAISHIRPDTITLAISRGVDLSLQLTLITIYGIPGHNLITGSAPIGTPIDIAIRTRLHSPSAASHADKLKSIAILLAAGAPCTTGSLKVAAQHGDLDLLTLCIPYLPDINARDYHRSSSLLDIAACHGHVQLVHILIAAGSIVNSVGVGSYPALWVCGYSPIAVVQALLDAGADATWRTPNGVSVVQQLRRTARGAAGIEDCVRLLVRYGAVDERPMDERAQRPQMIQRRTEYWGWREPPKGWVEEAPGNERDEGCGCPSCPIECTGGYQGVRIDRQCV